VTSLRLIAIGLLLLVSSCQRDRPRDSDADSFASAAGCAELDLLSQVVCYADSAVERGDLVPCEAAAHEGVQYQCYAVVAERQDDPRLCQEIPPTTAEHLSLKDLCLSDIAKNRLDPELCGAVQAEGIRDGCYFAVAEGIPDRTICTEVTDEGLRRLCVEGPSL